MSEPLHSIDDTIRRRRATRHFEPRPLPEGLLEEMLSLAVHAPSGYNLQPWRFLAVTTPEARERLAPAAYNQPQVREASVVLVCCGETRAVEDFEEVFAEALRRGAVDERYVASARKGTRAYLGSVDLRAWAFKQTMIAVAHLMLLAESRGLDTSPMEGFVEDKVKVAFGIPESVVIPCLLAIGYGAPPEPKFAGRLPLERVLYRETWGGE